MHNVFREGVKTCIHYIPLKGDQELWSLFSLKDLAQFGNGPLKD